jgi:hypothetical protein
MIFIINLFMKIDAYDKEEPLSIVFWSKKIHVCFQDKVQIVMD